MIEGDINIARIIRWLIGTVLLGLIAWGLVILLTHGAVDLGTNDKSTEITVIKNDKSEQIKATGKGSLFAILPNGTYIVSAKNSTSIQRSEVTVLSFSVTKKQLAPKKNLNIQPLTNIQSTSFHASGSSLGLLDEDSGKISHLDHAGSYTYTSNTYGFENAVWESDTKGYAFGMNYETQKKVLVKFDGTNIQEIATPQPITNATYFAYNIATDGTLYIIEDGALYRYKNGSFERRASVNKENFILSATSEYISMLYRDKQENCEIQLFSLTTNQTKKIALNCVQSPDYIYSAEWSPDSKHLIVSSGGNVDVYNKDFKKIYSAPDATASNGVWNGNDSIVYASKNKLWRYNLATKTADTISIAPEYITLLNLKKSGDEYIFAGRADSTITLYKTSASEPPLELEKIAESNMHQLSDSCRIRYINIPSLTIIAGTSEAQKGECESSIKDYLSSISISNPLPIHYVLAQELGYAD